MLCHLCQFWWGKVPYSIVNSQNSRVCYHFDLPGFWISSRAWLIWPSHNANSPLNSERDQVTASVNKPLWCQLVEEAEQKHVSCHCGFVFWTRLMWFGNDNKFFFLSLHGSEFNKRAFVACTCTICIQDLWVYSLELTYFLKPKWQNMFFNQPLEWHVHIFSFLTERRITLVTVASKPFLIWYKLW